MCIENIEHYLSTCCDCIGLLLMIKITHAHSMVMQRRRVPVLDSFFDRVNMLLWPRFKAVFDNNLKRWEVGGIALLQLLSGLACSSPR